MKIAFTLFLLFCTLISTQAKNFDFEFNKFECLDSIVKPGDLILVKANVALFGDTIPENFCGFQLYLSTDTIIDNNDIKFCDGQSALTGERACYWFNFYWDENPKTFADFLSVPVPYDLGGNGYYLIGFVDYQEKHAETNENNNIKYIPLTVTGTANNDFFIQNVSVHDVTLKPNQKFSFSFENCYAGDNEFEMKPILNFMYSRDTIWGNADDDIQVYTDPWTGPTLSHLNSVELVNWNFDIKSGLQGDYYLLIKTDWGDRFKEVYETNNFAKIKIFIEEEVNDYWIESLSSNYTTLQPDQQIQLTCESRYQGNNAAVLDARIYYYFSKDSILDETDRSLLEYGVGGHAILSYQFTVFTDEVVMMVPYDMEAGEYYLIAKIVIPASFPETNVGNNTVSIKVNVTGPVRHDFYPSNIQFPKSDGLHAGVPMPINAVLNYGGNSYSYVRGEMQLFLSTDALLDSLDKPMRSIQAEYIERSMSTKDLSFDVVVPLVPETGNYYVLAVVDPEKKMLETNENNNVAYTKIQVTEKATRDFSISNLLVYKSAFYINSSIAISYNLDYSGNSYDLLTVKSNCVLSVNEVWGDADDVVLYNTYDITSIVNQENQTAKCIIKEVYVPPTVKPGKYNLLVKADVTGLHAETDETNNIAKFEIEVLDLEIDLFVKNLSVDVDTVYAGNVFDVSGYFNLVSQSGQEVYSNCNFYLSSDKQLGNSDDVLLSEMPIYFMDSKPYQTFSISMPKEVQAGSYYLFAQADSNNQTKETNEENNAARIPFLVSQNGVNDFYIENFTVSKDTIQINEKVLVGFDIRYAGNSKSMIPCYYTASLASDILSEDWSYGTTRMVTLSKDSTLRHVEIELQGKAFFNTDAYVLVKVNSYSPIEEANKENNTAARKIRLAGYPQIDFSISNLELITDTINVNSQLHMKFDVAYDGVINNSVQARVLYVLSKNDVLGDNDDVYFSGANITFNPESDMKRETVAFKNQIYDSSLTLGEYNLFVYVAPYQNKEVDMENNWQSQPIWIEGPKPCDFLISGMNLAAESVFESSFIHVECTLQNKNGFNLFNTPRILAHLSKDTIWGNNDDVVCGTVYQTTLSETENTRSIEQRYYIASNITAGSYYLLLKVDADNQCNETDETNNLAFQPIRIKTVLADLYIDNLNVTPNAIRNGNDMTISGRLRSRENQLVLGQSVINFYISENDQLGDSDDLRLYDMFCVSPNIDSLTGNFTIQTRYLDGLSVGSYHLIAQILSSSNLDVSSSNNIAVAPFSIACKRSLVHEFIDLCGDETYLGWDTEGDYERAYISKAGCDSIVYTHIRKYEVPAKPTIALNDGELLSSSTLGNQWYLEQNPVKGATGAVHTVGAKGNYAVQIVDEFGCDSELSDYLFVDYSSIARLEANLIAYPNPTTGLITIVGLPDVETAITVYDSVGKRMARKRIVGSDSNIDISDLPNGIYFLKFDNRNNPVLKIVKR